jgi:hypothetical protein
MVANDIYQKPVWCHKTARLLLKDLILLIFLTITVGSRIHNLKVENPTWKRKEIGIRHGFEEETAGTFTGSSRQAEFHKQRVPGSRDKFMLSCWWHQLSCKNE